MFPSRSALDRAIDLADVALTHPPGSALLDERGRPSAELAATPHRYGALVGLSCPSHIDLVAATHDVIVSVDGVARDARLSVAVARPGICVARYRTDGDVPRTLERLNGPLVDIGLRCLGLDTPPCHRIPLELLDAAFMDSVLNRVLDSDLGSPGPSWPEIVAAHPLVHTRTVTPLELRQRRLGIADVTWTEIRERILASTGRTHDHELTPALAGWLDVGSLARWLLARYPEPLQALGDACELLDPCTARALWAAHAPPRTVGP